MSVPPVPAGRGPSLSPGLRLGAYEITVQLGAGGMGEVYRARDTRLGREVALKILPGHLGWDPDRRQRFETEARAVAALSHSGIRALFDVGWESGIGYAAMELLEGETLRDRLVRGPVPPRKALEIGSQVAEALAAAHDKGIVHRDLKPENVFVTRDGRAKILDFGVAKLGGETGLAGGVLTDPGAPVGTAGYMAPEQVRGEAVDGRADIFALGALLHEMLSGARAFQGGTAPEILLSVLRDDPVSIPGLAAPLDALLRRCLEKQPEERFGSARDLAFQLAAQAQGLTSETLPRPPSRRGRLRWPAIALGAALLAVAIAAGLLWPRPAVAPTFQRLTWARGAVNGARFVPGSLDVAFSGSYGGPPAILLTRADQPEPRKVALPEAHLLAVSRSAELAILLHPRPWRGREIGTLAVAPLGGGGVRELREDVYEADFVAGTGDLAALRQRGGAYEVEWPLGTTVYRSVRALGVLRTSPDGSLLAVSEMFNSTYDGFSGARLLLIARSGATQEAATTTESTSIAWSPSGELLYSQSNRSQSSIHGVRPGGSPRLVWRGPRELRLEDVAEDGRILIQDFDLRAEAFAVIAGQPAEVDLSILDGSYVEDVSADGRVFVMTEFGGGPYGDSSAYLRRSDGSPPVRVGPGRAMDIAPDGGELLHRPSRRGPLMRVPTGAGESTSIEIRGLVFAEPYWFVPGARSVVVSGQREGEEAALHLVDLASGEARQITPPGAVNFAGQEPVSPDGRRVAAVSDEGRTLGIYPIDGGPAQQVIPLEPGLAAACWTGDGQGLVLFNRDSLPARLWRLDLRSGKRTLLREVTPRDRAGVVAIQSFAMTPDGATFAYNFDRVIDTLYVIDGLLR